MDGLLWIALAWPGLAWLGLILSSLAGRIAGFASVPLVKRRAFKASGYFFWGGEGRGGKESGKIKGELVEFALPVFFFFLFFWFGLLAWFKVTSNQAYVCVLHQCDWKRVTRRARRAEARGSGHSN